MPVRVAWLPEEHGPARGPAGRRPAGPRPVSPRRTAAAADRGPRAGPGHGPGRRARDGRRAAGPVGGDHRRRGARPISAATWPAGPRWRSTGPSTGCSARGTRRRAWSRRRSWSPAGSVRAPRGRCGAGSGCGPAALGCRCGSVADAGKILDELVAGWSRRLIDIMPTVGRLIYSRGFDPQIDYDPAQVERLQRGDASATRASCCGRTGPTSTRWSCDRGLQENGLPPRTPSPGSTWRSGRWARSCAGPGVIFIRRSTGDDPLYRYVLRSTSAT